MRYPFSLVLLAPMASGCESKRHKIADLEAQYNAANGAYQRDCADVTSWGAGQLLTGEKLTDAEMEDFEAKKRVQEARCKRQADHLAELQRQILTAQQ